MTSVVDTTLNSPNEKPEIIEGFSLYWFTSDCWLMAKRSVTHIIRSLDQVMGLIMFPIMFTLLNRFVLGGAIEKALPPDLAYVDYVFAGVFIQTLAFGANYTTINLAVDLKEGIVDRFRSLPMSNSALVIGHIISDLFRNVISGLIIVVVAFAIGFRPDAGITGWLGIILVSIFLTLAISSLSAILGLMVKSLEAAQWIGFVLIFPLTFISSAFVPTNTMSPALQKFADNQPLTQAMNYIRHVTIGTPQGDSLKMTLIWCTLIIAISIPMTTVMFKRRSNK